MATEFRAITLKRQRKEESSFMHRISITLGKKYTAIYTGILLSVFLLSGCSTAASLISGDVLLDSSIVEENIRDGVLEQSGLVIEVECPDPLSGQVGDTRQCLAQDEFGDSYLVDVTIQNREGYIVWEVQQ